MTVSSAVPQSNSFAWRFELFYRTRGIGSRRALAKRVAATPEEARAWEAKFFRWTQGGKVPSLELEAVVRALAAPGEVATVLAELTGETDPSHRTPPPGRLRVEHVEAAQHEREHGPGGAATMLRLLGSIAEGAEKAPEVDRARALDRINDLIKTARKAGLHLATAATLLITSAQNANAQESSANSRRQNWDFAKKKAGSARSSRRKAKVA